MPVLCKLSYSPMLKDLIAAYYPSSVLINCHHFSVKSRMAVGYNNDGSVAPLYDLGWAGPAGQMYSTVNDLMKVSNC